MESFSKFCRFLVIELHALSRTLVSNKWRKTKTYSTNILFYNKLMPDNNLLIKRLVICINCSNPFIGITLYSIIHIYSIHSLSVHLCSQHWLSVHFRKKVLWICFLVLRLINYVWTVWEFTLQGIQAWVIEIPSLFSKSNHLTQLRKKKSQVFFQKYFDHFVNILNSR